MENNDIIEQEKNVTILDKVYKGILNGIPGVSEPIEELADSYVSKYGRTEKAIDKMISNQKLKVTTTGFVAGLPGLLALPVTLPADLASSLYIEMRMIAAIAAIRGYNLRSDQVKTCVYVTMVGHSINEILKQVGTKIATQIVVKKLLPKLTRELIVKINRAVGFRLLTKAGSKGVINVSKCLPIIGGIIGGTFNYAEITIVAKCAKKMFNENA